ncbi:M12 family metallopeptidase [Halobacteriovorax sp. JY17]|uniref:M12 family metallopeptidase n=1 Tax=Halobacteriovorax sp. JY17 TaxID=2014617 RepID=UPI000C3F7D7A|nr:M12 family metallopeptidase [Halobacteriovorax sp. JY17]PIK15759.1 MAG: hypothetical protein CES88_03255 [Halobacteriovorax sp. JY17]
MFKVCSYVSFMTLKVVTEESMKRAKFLILRIILISFMALASVQGQIILKKNKWAPGQSLNVLFMNGSLEEKFLFKRAIEIWAKYVNLKFEFHSTLEQGGKLNSKFKTNTIRVKFNKDEGNFSPLGNRFNINSTDSISYLNIKESPDQKIKFISKSAHEIGHALGLMHEHQHPDLIFYKDEDEMIQICRYQFLLDVEKPENLKICKINLTGITHEEAREYGMGLSDFDQQSIMLYSDISNTTKGFFDTSVSLADKTFIAREYPHEEELEIEVVGRMHISDTQEEREWILKEYKQNDCALISEGDHLYLTKQTRDRSVKVRMTAMSAIDNYFTACVRNSK